ncbi:MAG: hypothetical protein KGL39_08390 [Patescibacteria group bacterium]|nr:hypothetical protein [Patescibacteria group bacterium]
MPIFESYKRAKEEKKAEGDKTEGNKTQEAAREEKKEKLPTVVEILKNKEESPLFGSYVGAHVENGTELAKKLASGETLSSEELLALSDARNGFFERMEAASNLKEMLGGQELQTIIDSNEYLQRLAEGVGVEALRDAVERQLSLMAVSGDSSFERLTASLNKLEATRSRMKEVDGKIREFISRYGISEDSMSKILANLPENPSAEQVAAAVRGEIGFFRRLRSKNSQESVVAQIKEMEKQGVVISSAELESLTKRLDDNFGSTGRLLNSVIKGNEEIRGHLTRALRSEEEPEEERNDTPFQEVVDLSSNADKTKKEIERSYEEFVEANDGKSEEERIPADQVESKFLEEYMGKNKKSGFWGEIFNIFLDSLIKEVVK